jgi:hypothetical protein
MEQMPHLRCSKVKAESGAKIMALSEPRTADGGEKTDIYNPDPRKRERPIIGLVLTCFYIWLYEEESHSLGEWHGL